MTANMGCRLLGNLIMPKFADSTVSLSPRADFGSLPSTSSLISWLAQYAGSHTMLALTICWLSHYAGSHTMLALTL